MISMCWTDTDKDIASYRRQSQQFPAPYSSSSEWFQFKSRQSVNFLFTFEEVHVKISEKNSAICLPCWCDTTESQSDRLWLLLLFSCNFPSYEHNPGNTQTFCHKSQVDPYRNIPYIQLSNSSLFQPCLKHLLSTRMEGALSRYTHSGVSQTGSHSQDELGSL